MKNIIQQGNQHNDIVSQHSISLFIVTTNNEILLLKTLSDSSICWQVPRFFYYDKQNQPKQAVSAYLQKLPMSFRLFEAFVATSKYDSLRTHDEEKILIALTSDIASSCELDPARYQWLSLQTILIEAQEHAYRYAPWFCSVIDGVALYIKTLLCQNQPNTQKTEWHLSVEPTVQDISNNH